MPNHQVFIDDSDCDDDISVTSTAPSEVRDTYPLERIIAERTVDDEAEDGSTAQTKEYLVKWEGYGIDRSTWEPGDNFENSDTLHEWQEQQMRESRGFLIPFDVEAWEDRQEEIRTAKEQRHARRNRNRKRLGLPISVWSDEDDEEAEGASARGGNCAAGVEHAPGTQTAISSKSTGDTPVTIRRKQPIYDSSDSDVPPTASPKRRKSQLSEQVPKKQSLGLRTKKGQDVTVKRAKYSHVTSDSDVETLQSPRRVKPALPKPGTVNSGWFNSFKPTTARASQSATAPVSLSVRHPSTAKALSGPLMKRTAPSKVVRKPSVSQSGPIAFTYAPVKEKALTSRKIQSLSHLNNTVKKNRNERAPALEDLDRFDLATGERVAAATATRPDWDAHSPISRRASLVNTNTSTGLESPIDLMTAWDRCGLPTAKTPPPAPLEDVPMTCWFWANKGSCFRESSCWYKHYHTGRVAPSHNSFKDTEEMTCPYWWEGICAKPDDICRYAHKQTKYLAPKHGGSKITVLDPDAVKPVFKSRSHLDRENLTCWYWYNRRGNCRYSESECAFAHHLTSAVVGRQGEPPVPIIRPPQAHQADQMASDINTPIDDAAAPQMLSTRSHDFYSLAPVYSTQMNTHLLQRHLPAPTDINVQFRVESFGSTIDEQLGFEATMTDLNDDAQKWFLAQVGATPVLRVGHVCVSYMAKSYLDTNRYPILATGNLTPLQNDDSSMSLCAENLKLHSAAALVFHTNFNMVIHPADVSDWDFLGQGSPRQNAVLRFHIIKPFISTVAELTAEENTETRKLVNVEKLFACADIKHRHRMVFLIFPDTRQSEMEDLTTFFQDLEVDVYRGDIPGAWDYFRHRLETAIVLIHHEFIHYQGVPKMAYLANFANLPFFELTPNTSPDGFAYAVQRLLPHGRAYLIMDDCFVHHPKQTLEVIKNLTERAKALPAFCRILGRPDLLTFLHELSRDNEDGPSGSQSSAAPSDLDRTQYQMVHLLNQLLYSEEGYIDRFNHPYPSQISPLYFGTALELPQYAEKWRRSEREAAEDLAQWFAKWAVVHIKEIKKFIILTHADERTKDRWERQWGHVAVLDPAEWLLEEKKKKKKPDGNRR